MNKLELGREKPRRLTGELSGSDSDAVYSSMHFSPVYNPHDFDDINIQFDCIDTETHDFSVAQIFCFTVCDELFHNKSRLGTPSARYIVYRDSSRREFKQGLNSYGTFVTAV